MPVAARDLLQNDCSPHLAVRRLNDESAFGSATPESDWFGQMVPIAISAKVATTRTNAKTSLCVCGQLSDRSCRAQHFPDWYSEDRRSSIVSPARDPARFRSTRRPAGLPLLPSGGDQESARGTSPNAATDRQNAPQDSLPRGGRCGESIGVAGATLSRAQIAIVRSSTSSIRRQPEKTSSGS